MKNSYFQFNNFQIYQRNAPMKVSMDAVTFGAWVEKKCQNDSSEKWLDIGSGTGLLAAMLQQNSARIFTCIESDERCIEDLYTNTPQDKTYIFHADFREWVTMNQTQVFDNIMANPPWFQPINLHQNTNKQYLNMHRDKARQYAALSPHELWKGIDTISHNKTQVFLLYGEQTWEDCIKIGKDLGWHLSHQLSIQSKWNKKPHALAGCWSRICVEPIHDKIIYKDENGNNSQKYQDLVKSWYPIQV